MLSGGFRLREVGFHPRSLTGWFFTPGMMGQEPRPTPGGFPRRRRVTARDAVRVDDARLCSRAAEPCLLSRRCLILAVGGPAENRQTSLASFLSEVVMAPPGSPAGAAEGHVSAGTDPESQTGPSAGAFTGEDNKRWADAKNLKYSRWLGAGGYF